MRDDCLTLVPTAIRHFVPPASIAAKIGVARITLLSIRDHRLGDHVIGAFQDDTRSMTQARQTSRFQRNDSLSMTAIVLSACSATLADWFDP